MGEPPGIKWRRWHTCGHFSGQILKERRVGDCGWTWDRSMRIGACSGKSRAYGPGWALTKVIGEPPAILLKHDTLILQVTLVPHKDDLSIVPGVGLDLGGPVEFEGC